MSKFIAVVLLRTESCQASDGISKEMATRLACKRQSKHSRTSWWFLLLKTIDRVTHLWNRQLANWSPLEVAMEPIFNRLAEDREHVKISKMFLGSYALRLRYLDSKSKWMQRTYSTCDAMMWRNEVLICSAARCPQAGCANPKGHLLWKEN